MSPTKAPPPRPLPSEPFLKSGGFDWHVAFVILGVTAFAIAFGGLFFAGVASELSRQDKFRRDSEIVRICADGTRIYRFDGRYCSWLCRERFTALDVCL